MKGSRSPASIEMANRLNPAGRRKKLRPDERFTMTCINRDGQPIEPSRTKDAFSAQCGVLVRDMIPIRIQQWNKPKAGDPEVSFVTDRQKYDLWTALKDR